MTSAVRLAATGAGPPLWLDESAVRDAAREVIAGPDYDLERAATPPSGEWLLEWIVWLLTPLRWCFEMMDGLPEGLRWLIIVLLCLVLLALVVHIVWSLTASFQPQRIRKLNLASSREDVDPQDFERQAREFAERGDYVEACRRLLLASIGWLQLVRRQRLRPGVTNRELLREYASTSIAEPLRQLVQTIDAKWYGDEPCHLTDYEACGASHTLIRQVVKEKRDAVGA